MPSKTKSPTSGCCCLGVRCPCPKGKVCPSMKRDVNRIRQYILQNKLTDEEASKYRSSLYSEKRKSKKKSVRKSKKSVRKSKKKSVRKSKKKSVRKSKKTKKSVRK